MTCPQLELARLHVITMFTQLKLQSRQLIAIYFAHGFDRHKRRLHRYDEFGRHRMFFKRIIPFARLICQSLQPIELFTISMS